MTNDVESHADDKRVDVARSTTEVELQRTLVSDPQTDVRAGLARNPNLAPELQRVLAEDPDVYVRSRLAGNTSLTAELQLELLGNKSWQTHVQLAHNPSVGPEVQRAMASSPDGALRSAIGFHPNLLADLALALASDPGAAVRYAVMANPTVELTHQFPVESLLDSQRGQAYLEQELKGVDGSARNALVDSWSGTLGELLVALEHFS